MTLNEFIELLEVSNYNSKLTLEYKQAMQLLNYLKELQYYRDITAKLKIELMLAKYGSVCL